jgi:hypothetical protein
LLTPRLLRRTAAESRNTNLNMDRVEKDLEAVKKENASLLPKLKALAGKG